MLDFGSQYTQLIARRIREANVYCEIMPFDVSDAEIRGFAPRGIVLSGGPETVLEGSAPRIPDVVFALDVPVLGICYGMQAMALQLGGRVQASQAREFGSARLNLNETTRERVSSWASLVRDISPEFTVWMSHGDKVTSVPPGFEVVASSENAEIAAMVHDNGRWIGLQFHPEVTHTNYGTEIISRFALTVCGCRPEWTSAHIADAAIAQVREQVGDQRVILGLSGGVDSSVVAALLARAIGDQLYCVFVDNGLLRLNEREEVEAAFAPSNALNLNLITVDARDEFLSALAGKTDPEEKRKQIGTTFVDVFEREADAIEGARFLAQGTIYPDVIESAASKFGKAHVIKSHHNVGGLPDRLGLDLVEPLRELFKDEVRQLGTYLGLPDAMIHRHPFPGPGLAVRCLGEVRAEKLDVLRRADAIFLEILHAWDYYRQVSQAFAVYLPVKSVGVVGDARRYADVIALRAVQTTDFMTAGWAELPYGLIAEASNRIINEISEVSRVVYDVSSKPPATIEWE